MSHKLYIQFFSDVNTFRNSAILKNMNTAKIILYTLVFVFLIFFLHMHNVDLDLLYESSCF